jgi:hypothetical protein
MFDNDTFLYRDGATPNTRTMISSKNKVYSYAAGQSGFSRIGVMTSFDPSESRAIEQVRGVGYGDQIAELVPGITDAMTISVVRTALYLSNVYQVFGYFSGVDGLVRSLKHHKWPFDIKQEVVFSEIASDSFQRIGTNVSPELPASTITTAPSASGGNINALITVYEACWLSSYSASYPNDQTPVAENVEITVSDVLDGRSVYNEFVETGNSPLSGTNGQLGSVRFRDGVNAGVI